jgi:hypothetical protein
MAMRSETPPAMCAPLVVRLAGGLAAVLRGDGKMAAIVEGRQSSKESGRVIWSAEGYKQQYSSHVKETSE